MSKTNNFLKTTLFKRIVFSLVLLLIIIPTLILNYYGQIYGRIIAFVIITSVISYGFSEVINVFCKTHYLSEKIINFLFALFLILTIFFIPFDNFSTILVYGPPTYVDILQPASPLTDLFRSHFNYWIFLIPLFYSIGFILIHFKLMFSHRENPYKLFVILLILVFVIPIFAKVLWLVSIFSLPITFFLIGIPIVSDTSAYVGGMLLGRKLIKRPFAPTVSPKKSWEGAIIAFLITSLYTGLVGWGLSLHQTMEFPNDIFYFFLVLSLLVSFISQFGDLFFSWIKRNSGIKDFSNLIPGHGGIFDRLDSVSFVFFVFLIIFYFYF